MMHALQRYLNAVLIGFIVTFVIYLFWPLNQSEMWRGAAIAVVGAALSLGVFIFLDRKFGGEDPELFDRDGNLVDRKGKILRAKSQL